MEYMDDMVHLSNKSCRHYYGMFRLDGDPRNCTCPEGRCWYLEQRARREAGEKAIDPKCWTEAATP